MKFTAVIFTATVAASATAAGMPSPYPSPAPADPPAPATDHVAPAPKGSYNSNLWGSPAPDNEMSCEIMFNNACRGTAGKACSQCVTNNAMQLVAGGCDTIQLIAKHCPVDSSSRRSLRRGLVDLVALPSPYPSPSPADPPAPADGRVAPAPRFDYGPVMWSPAPIGTQDSAPANVKACDSMKSGFQCTYVTNTGESITGACTFQDSVMVCAGSVVNCADEFASICGATTGRTCAQCVLTNDEALSAAGCDKMKLISGSCPE